MLSMEDSLWGYCGDDGCGGEYCCGGGDVSADSWNIAFHVPQGVYASSSDTTPVIILGLQPLGNSVLIVGGVVKE